MYLETVESGVVSMTVKNTKNWDGSSKDWDFKYEVRVNGVKVMSEKGFTYAFDAWSAAALYVRRNLMGAFNEASLLADGKRVEGEQSYHEEIR